MTLMQKPDTSLTIRTFSDLLRIVETRPAWRHRMVKALFPEVNVPKALQELAEQQCRTEATIQRLGERIESGFAEATAERKTGLAEAAMDHKALEERVEAGFAEAAAERKSGFAEAAAERRSMRAAHESLAGRVESGFAEAAAAREAGFAEAAAERQSLAGRMETGFAEAAVERQSLAGRMETGFAEAAADRKEIRRAVGELKGISHERTYRDKADAIFGSYLKRGRKVTSSVSEQLYDAIDAGTILEQEQRKVLAADLLWGGRLHKTGEEVVLVIEASWLAEETDVDRAVERANILRKIGLNALPVVAAREWAAGIPEMACERKVVMTTNGRIDEDSWQAAVTDIFDGH